MTKIPTPHIEATSKDEIANTVLMPGDPLRAKYIAETFLDDVTQFNQVRGMLGYTGYYKGKRVSVMGSGMGVPSSLIYYHELFNFYGVETIIRIGSAGTMQEYVRHNDIILATAASTDSTLNANEFGRFTFAPTADFELLLDAYNTAKKHNYKAHTGMVVCGDQFYDEPETEVAMKKFTKYGAIAADMESAALYTEALRHGKRALSIFTISDDQYNEINDTPEMREQGYSQMMTLALEIAPE